MNDWRELLGYAIIIKGTGPHGLEEASSYFRLRHTITGFTGTAGTLILTPSQKNIFITDARYSALAQKSFDDSYLIIEEQEDKWSTILPAVVSHIQSAGDTKNFNGFAICDAQFSIHEYETIRTLCLEHTNREPQLFPYNLYAAKLATTSSHKQAKSTIQTSWKFDTNTPIPYPKRLKNFIKSIPANAKSYLSFSPYEFAYLTGFRAHTDTSTMLPPLAFLITATTNTISLWLDENIPLPKEITKSLIGWTITRQTYQQIYLSLNSKDISGSTSYDPKLVPVMYLPILRKEYSFTSNLKHHSSILTEDEIAGVKNAALRDSRSLSRALTEFKNKSSNKDSTIDEYQLRAQMDSRNTSDPQYIKPAFSTIVTAGPHGKMIHYSVTAESSIPIEYESAVVIDTGSHFTDGSTDITRTLYRGLLPSKTLKHDYTMVLKSHIALCSARFLQGSTGKFLDELCRAPMKEANLDYPHGTGHGLGLATDVHWGHVFLHRDCDIAVERGMLFSIEPGYYTKTYGIRLENLAIIVEKTEKIEGDSSKTAAEPALAFEVITFVPFEELLIDHTLLTTHEKTWLDWYQARSYKLQSSH